MEKDVATQNLIGAVVTKDEVDLPLGAAMRFFNNYLLMRSSCTTLFQQHDAWFLLQLALLDRSTTSKRFVQES